MALGAFALGCEDALRHLLNYVWPNIFETSPHVINAVFEAIEGLRVALGPTIILQYTLQVPSYLPLVPCVVPLAPCLVPILPCLVPPVPCVPSFPFLSFFPSAENESHHFELPIDLVHRWAKIEPKWPQTQTL